MAPAQSLPFKAGWNKTKTCHTDAVAGDGLVNVVVADYRSASSGDGSERQLVRLGKNTKASDVGQLAPLRRQRHP